MKLNLKYLILFFALFFSGAGHVSGAARQDAVANTQTHSDRISLESSCWDFVLGRHVQAKTSTVHIDLSDLVATETENEDDEWGAEDVYIDTSNYFMTHFLTPPTGYFIHCIKNRLQQGNSVSFALKTSTNVLYQVFRI